MSVLRKRTRAHCRLLQHRLEEGVRRFAVEFDVDFGPDFVGQLVQLTACRHRHEQHAGLFFISAIKPGSAARTAFFRSLTNTDSCRDISNPSSPPPLLASAEQDVNKPGAERREIRSKHRKGRLHGNGEGFFPSLFFAWNADGPNGERRFRALVHTDKKKNLEI